MITHSHPPDRVGIRWLSPGLKVYHIPFPTIASSATLPNFFTFLPYLRTIALREHIDTIHGHASLSSLAHEGILHAHHMGIRTVFTDHSLFGFDDAASILTNKLLAGMLSHADAAICVSHTGHVDFLSSSHLPTHKPCFSSRENTILRSKLAPREETSTADTDDLSDEEDDSDDTSSTGYQDHEQVIKRKFGLDPGRIYVIPNAVVADKFRPYPRKQTDKCTSRLMATGSHANSDSHNRRPFSAGLPQRHRSIGSDRPKNLRYVPPCSFRDRCVFWELILDKMLTG